jgi:hypothetical protein
MKTPSLRLASLLVLLLAALWLSGCVRPVSSGNTPSPQSTNLLEELLTSTPIPITTETQVPEDTPTAEPSATPGPTSTLHVITPTLSPEPTETLNPTDQAEGTQEATSTAEPQPTSDVPQINPDEEFTGAKRTDTLDQEQMWYDRSGSLPDTEYLKLEFVDGSMLVTGKLRLWDTWWISGFSLNDYYIEMEVNSGDCNPDDAYGMILRASQHGEPTHGYLVAFTCDGEVFAKRLDTVDPYTAVSILNPTETDLIYEGKNQNNILGVLLDGDTISIYPNRRFFTTIVDDAFSFGRYGIFVQAGDAGNFTYSVSEIRTWVVE